MMHMLTDPQIWAAFLTLTVLEIVLGIDNIIFLSILCGRLPPEQQKKARAIGLSLALVMRIGLLFCVSWLTHMEGELFSVMGHGISLRDIVLCGGGLFLLYKATGEIHHEMEEKHEESGAPKVSSMSAIIGQIIMLDLVFSLDSILTAIGMVDQLPVIIAAIVVSILVMLFAAAPVSNFVNAHPTVKMLALGFLMLVGVMLIAESFEFHIPRGYIYFAIAFSMGVECLNLLAAKKRRKKKIKNVSSGS